MLYRALHERWHSAFSELIVARTLQLLGGDIEAEPESEAGTRIDFRACFADGEVGVEVVSPVIDPDAGEVKFLARDHRIPGPSRVEDPGGLPP